MIDVPSDDSENDDIWQACVSMISGMPDDMTLDRKLLAISLFLSVVALYVSNGDMERVKDLIADVADGAVILADKQKDTFRFTNANMPNVSRRKQ